MDICRKYSNDLKKKPFTSATDAYLWERQCVKENKEGVPLGTRQRDDR